MGYWNWLKEVLLNKKALNVLLVMTLFFGSLLSIFLYSAITGDIIIAFVLYIITLFFGLSYILYIISNC